MTDARHQRNPDSVRGKNIRSLAEVLSLDFDWKENEEGSKERPLFWEGDVEINRQAYRFKASRSKKELIEEVMGSAEAIQWDTADDLDCYRDWYIFRAELANENGKIVYRLGLDGHAEPDTRLFEIKASLFDERYLDQESSEPPTSSTWASLKKGAELYQWLLTHIERFAEENPNRQLRHRAYRYNSRGVMPQEQWDKFFVPLLERNGYAFVPGRQDPKPGEWTTDTWVKDYNGPKS